MVKANHALSNSAQDARKKRTAKRFCVTSVTDLLLVCFVVTFTQVNVLRKVKFDENVFSNKIIVTLVTQGLPSSFLSRPVA